MPLDPLAEVFASALDLPPETDFAGLVYRGVPEWDSLAHMTLVAALETTFDVQLDTDEVLALDSFSAARRILSAHGVAAVPA